MGSMTEGVTTRGGVPFLDLGRSHAPILDEVMEDVREILESSGFVGGPRVAAFEEAFAGYCEIPYCVGVASGLDALRLALQSLGIGPGAEVVVPAMTFVATFEAVSQVGATPVPVDVTDRDYCLDPEAAAAVVGPRTRAILPVHLYGQMADMRAIERLAKNHGLAIVEDACQAHGASRDSVRPGELSEAAAFSFYPGKNLGAMGDAGALITADETIAASVPQPPRARTGAEVRARRHRLDVSARHRAGRIPLAQAARARSLEHGACAPRLRLHGCARRGG